MFVLENQSARFLRIYWNELFCQMVIMWKVGRWRRIHVRERVIFTHEESHRIVVSQMQYLASQLWERSNKAKHRFVWTTMRRTGQHITQPCRTVQNPSTPTVTAFIYTRGTQIFIGQLSCYLYWRVMSSRRWNNYTIIYSFTGSSRLCNHPEKTTCPATHYTDHKI